MSISERLDRCMDDFTNMIENMVVDQTQSYQITENRPGDETEGDGMGDQKIH